MNNKAGYRDIDRWRETCKEQRKRYYRKTQNALNTYARWSKSEDIMVLRHDITDTELSKKIGRSVAAIQIRRWKLKKWSE